MLNSVNINKTVKSINDLNRKLVLKGKYKTLKIMEVCGTHTMAIARYGIEQLLPENISLISGPGCPVCVTPIKEIDIIIEMIRKHEITVFTFGDLMRVPGTYSSLYTERSRGKKIKICYSPSDALDYAESNPAIKVVFIAIGFETTAPLTAILVKRTHNKGIKNFFIFSVHKTVPNSLEALLSDKQINIGGFLLPGHVSAIIGSKPYSIIPKKYKLPCVIGGFEPLQILLSIYNILNQIKNGVPSVEIQYRSVVKPEGNPVAVKNIYDVFEPVDSGWRGLGTIPSSGLSLKGPYKKFDAKMKFPVGKIISREPPGCICGDVLKGIKKPVECKNFAKTCNPSSPLGACMVSSEGACAAFFKYYRNSYNYHTGKSKP